MTCMLREIPDSILWAKTLPRKSLFAHLRETAAVARVLLQKSSCNVHTTGLHQLLGLDCEEEAVRLGSYLAGLHDIGKAHPLFTIKDETSPEIRAFFNDNPSLKYPVQNLHFRHEAESAEALIRIWRSRKWTDNRSQHAFATVLALHHQKKRFPSGDLLDDLYPAGEMWIRAQARLEQSIRTLTNPPVCSVRTAPQFDAGCMLLSAVVILADWIASGIAFQSVQESATELELERLAEAFIAEVGLMPGVFPETQSFAHLWPGIKQPRPVQSLMDTCCQGEAPLLTIIEAPMGEGKTEAGLYAACRGLSYWQKNGFYVALPTAATANQMWCRMKHICSEHEITRPLLMHSTAWLNPEFRLSSDDRNDAEEWLLTSRKGLLAQTGVGTVDQVMMAAMRIRFVMLRLLGIAGKALVIDEVHAYDAYMTNIIIGLLRWCRALKVPVVMLSATLPADRKRQLLSVYGETEISSAYPLVTQAFLDGEIRQSVADGSFQRYTVEVNTVPCLNDPEAIARLITRRAAEGGCHCVILSTVKDAQEVYRCVLAMAEPDTELMLFHSRFTVARRHQIEDRCIALFGKDSAERPVSAILVATQVVEQSLDLDFDSMISAAAPIDLILQRIGRLHRHRTTKRPVAFTKPILTILYPAEEGMYQGTGRVYFPILLERTRVLLNKREKLQLPEDIRPLIEDVYEERVRNEEEQESFLARSQEMDAESYAGRFATLPAPREHDFQLSCSAAENTPDSENDKSSLKTRFSGDSANVAILPGPLYDRINDGVDGSQYPSKELCERVLQYSFRLPSYLLNDVDLSEVPTGGGRLNWLLLFRAREGYQNAEPTGCFSAEAGEVTFITDAEFGCDIVKRKNNVI